MLRFRHGIVLSFAAVIAACSSTSGNDPGPLRYGGGAGETALPQAGAGGDATTGGGGAAGSTSTSSSGGQTASAGAPSATAIVRSIAPSDTDPAIPAGDPHVVVLRDPPRPCADKSSPYCDGNGNLSLLLVHLAREGSHPDDAKTFLTQAAVAGYHVVSLAWPSDVDVAAACDADPDASCYENVRLEILDGTDHSPKADVPPASSIEHRLVALLQYLDAANPGESWGPFLEGGAPKWSLVVASGHSSGGAEAAVLAKAQLLRRVLLFASPTDGTSKPAAWISSEHATAPGQYFGFVHTKDAAYMRVRSSWTLLGLDAFGDAVNVDQTIHPGADAQEIVTTFPPQTKNDADDHDAVITDAATPLDLDGKPIYAGAWAAMLGP